MASSLSSLVSILPEKIHEIANADMIIKHMKHVVLNTKVAGAVFNTQI